MVAGPVRGGFRQPILTVGDGQSRRKMDRTPYDRAAGRIGDKEDGIVGRLTGAVKRWLFSLGSTTAFEPEAAESGSQVNLAPLPPLAHQTPLCTPRQPTVPAIRSCAVAPYSEPPLIKPPLPFGQPVALRKETPTEILSDLILLPQFRASKTAAFRQLGEFFAAKDGSQLTRYEFDQVASVLKRLTVPNAPSALDLKSKPIFQFRSGISSIKSEAAPEEAAMEFFPKLLPAVPESSEMEIAEPLPKRPYKAHKEPSRVFSARFVEDDEPPSVDDLGSEYRVLDKTSSILVPVLVQPLLHVKELPQLIGHRLAPKPHAPAAVPSSPAAREHSQPAGALPRPSSNPEPEPDPRASGPGTEVRASTEKTGVKPIQPLFTTPTIPPFGTAEPPADLLPPKAKSLFDFGPPEIGSSVNLPAEPVPKKQAPFSFASKPSGNGDIRGSANLGLAAAAESTEARDGASLRYVGPGEVAGKESVAERPFDGVSTIPPAGLMTTAQPTVSLSGAGKDQKPAFTFGSLSDVTKPAFVFPSAPVVQATEAKPQGLFLGQSAPPPTGASIGSVQQPPADKPAFTGFAVPSEKPSFPAASAQNPPVMSAQPAFSGFGQLPTAERQAFGFSFGGTAVDKPGANGPAFGASSAKDQASIAEKPSGFSFAFGQPSASLPSAPAAADGPGPFGGFGKSAEGAVFGSTAPPPPTLAPAFTFAQPPRDQQQTATDSFGLGSGGQPPFTFNFGAAAQPSFVFGQGQGSTDAQPPMNFSLGSSGSPAAGSLAKRRPRR